MTAALHKLIYLCYELDGRTKEQTRRVLLDDCAPELSAGTARLQMNIDDPLAAARMCLSYEDFRTTVVRAVGPG